MRKRRRAGVFQRLTSFRDNTSPMTSKTRPFKASFILVKLFEQAVKYSTFDYSLALFGLGSNEVIRRRHLALVQFDDSTPCAAQGGLDSMAYRN